MAARVAVLASGSGSNLQALIDAAAAGAAFEIVHVVVNRPDAFAYQRARRAGIPATLIDHRRFDGRRPFEIEVERVLDDAGAEWVALAGFMRVLTPAFVEARYDRILNIHPSLLPAFRGLHTHRRVLAAGVRITGCTVHLARAELDDGPIVVQAAVPVADEDDEAALAARVLEREHQAYPLALELLALGAAVVVGGRVRLTTPATTLPAGFVWPGRA